MEPIDLRAKLCRLGDHLAELPVDDATFVTEMLTRLQSGNTLFLADILRIKDMLVPGEIPRLTRSGRKAASPLLPKTSKK